MTRLRTRLSGLSSEARRWGIGFGLLVIAGIGMASLWGVGWGLLLVGLGGAIVVLLYDPDRRPRP